MALGIMLHENAKTIKPEAHPRWPQEFIWFFAIFHQELRQGHCLAFAVLMLLAVAHFCGFSNPQQRADFLGIPHQKCYTELQHGSVYHRKKMLLRFLVKQAVAYLKPGWHHSAATQSRAGRTLSLANRGIARWGTLLQCTGSWLSGRHHDVVRGQDVRGMVLTLNHIAGPLHWLFCSKQGR